MKQQIIYIIVLLAFLCSSCNMDELPYAVNAEQLATDQEGAEQLVTGIYSAFWSSYMMKKTYQEWIDMDHDLNAAADWVVSGAGQGNVTTHWGYNGDSDLYTVFYMIINRCNNAKAALEASDVSDPAIGQRLGEVLFLRAFSYFHLVRMYGPVPLRLEPISPDDCARSPIADVYNTIVSDLTAAIEHLKYASSAYVGAWGHADKTAARILLARVYCTMASGKLAGDRVTMNVNIMNQAQQAQQTNPDEHPIPLKLMTFTTQKVMGDLLDDGYAVFDAQELYTKAKIQCDSVISREGYPGEFGLKPNWTDLWGTDNEKNSEFVWGINSYDHVDYTPATPYYYGHVAYGAGSYVSLSDACWAMYNYVPNSTDNDARAQEGVYHYYKSGTYERNAQWYRFPYGDMKYNTAPDGLKPANSNEYVIDGKSSITGWIRGAAFSNKWYYGKNILSITPEYAPRSETTIPHDIVLIRFAEAYLLRAEARNEIGDGAGALADLNVIRNRANAKPQYTTTDQIELRSWIFQERGLEFTQEFNRKFDLLRWGMYLNVMNATQSILTSSNQIISLVREPRSLLFAVPTSEVQQNNLFGNNNPGW